MLTEKRRTTDVASEAIVNDCTYVVNHTIVNNALVKLTCNVTKQVAVEMPTPTGVQTVEQPMAVGSIRKENGKTSIDLNETEDVIAHITVFNQIVAEIESGLTATRKAVKA